MKDINDIDNWVEDLKKGDCQAFCELYAFYKDRVIYYASQLLKSKNLAEDVYQDTFISIWQNRSNIDTDKSFSSYLYTIVRNRIFNIYRDSLREQQLKDLIFSNAIDISTETEDKLEDKDLNLLMEEIIQHLPSRQQQIFRMSRIEMMSYKEIAEKMNLSVVSVQKLMSDSLTSIREALTKYAEIYPRSLILLIWIFKY